MSGEKTSKEKFDGIFDDLDEHLDSLSDEEALEEAKELYEDVDARVSTLRSNVEDLILKFQKGKMQTAKEELEIAKQNPQKGRWHIPNTTEARRRLFDRVTSSPELVEELTHAFREKDSPPSDEDIQRYLEQMGKLGLLPDDDGE